MTESDSHRPIRGPSLQRLSALTVLLALAACGGGGGSDGAGGIGGGGGGGPATGAASDCANPALAEVGTTFRWDYQISGAATGGVRLTARLDGRVTRITTFAGVADVIETEIVSTGPSTGSPDSGTDPVTQFSYTKIDGLVTTQYGRVTEADGLTVRAVWSPPWVNRSATLAVGVPAVTSWTSTETYTYANGSAPTTVVTDFTTQFTYRGQETVTVPAGTFTACRFDIQETSGATTRTSTTWLSVGTGAPVKNTSEGGTANEVTFELLETSSLNGQPL